MCVYICVCIYVCVYICVCVCVCIYLPLPNVLSLLSCRFTLLLHCITENISLSYAEHPTLTAFLDWITDLLFQGDLQEFTPDEAEFFTFTLVLYLAFLALLVSQHLGPLATPSPCTHYNPFSSPNLRALLNMPLHPVFRESYLSFCPRNHI
uniref:Uncharacterized protein n=1 Tax=Theropithecus gelada TaxID=9565 RepID=A0A8D2FL05_THEGE